MEDFIELEFPTSLFTIGSEPMQFVLDETRENQPVAQMIMHGGGCIESSKGPYTIFLSSPTSEVQGDEPVYSTKFIKDCCEAKKILHLSDYRLNCSGTSFDDIAMKVLLRESKWPMDKESGGGISTTTRRDSESDGELESPSNRVRRRRNLSVIEEKKILEYIVKYNAIGLIEGNTLWKEIAHKKMCPNLSWKMLKKHFMQSTLPNISRYTFLSIEDRLRFQKQNVSPVYQNNERNLERVSEERSSNASDKHRNSSDVEDNSRRYTEQEREKQREQRRPSSYISSEDNSDKSVGSLNGQSSKICKPVKMRSDAGDNSRRYREQEREKRREQRRPSPYISSEENTDRSGEISPRRRSPKKRKLYKRRSRYSSPKTDSSSSVHKLTEPRHHRKPERNKYSRTQKILGDNDETQVDVERSNRPLCTENTKENGGGHSAPERSISRSPYRHTDPRNSRKLQRKKSPRRSTSPDSNHSKSSHRQTERRYSGKHQTRKSPRRRSSSESYHSMSPHRQTEPKNSRKHQTRKSPHRYSTPERNISRMPCRHTDPRNPRNLQRKKSPCRSSSPDSNHSKSSHRQTERRYSGKHQTRKSPRRRSSPESSHSLSPHRQTGPKHSKKHQTRRSPLPSDSSIDDWFNSVGDISYRPSGSRYVDKRPPRNIRKRRREEFTTEEELSMLKYLEKHNRFDNTGGNNVWKLMASSQDVGARHTWQSLRERYLKKIVPNIDKYNVAEDVKRSIKSKASKR